MIAETLLFFVFLSVIGVFAYFYSRSQQKRADTVEWFRSSVMKQMRSPVGISLNRIARLTAEIGISEKEAIKTKSEIYSELFKRALGDGQISEREKSKLDTISTAFDINPTDRARLELPVRQKVYLNHVRQIRRLSERISTDHAKHILKLQRDLGLSRQDVQNALSVLASSMFKERFNVLIRSGQFSDSASLELSQLLSIVGFTHSEALYLVRQESIDLYREWFYEAKQDGCIDEAEECLLDELQFFAGLTDADVRVYKQEIQHIRDLEKFRQGILPISNTNKLFEGGEICHLDLRCTYQWQLKRRRQGQEYYEYDQVSGDLAITSNRIVFTSQTKNFEFRPSKIINLTLYSDGIEIQTTSSRGTGAYLVSDPEAVEAILYGLVKRHKYQLAESFSSSYSRHIPDAVKREVWARDGGHCNKCSATEYLEFDHIIPHSKGGANTVNNIQLLCRKCNLAKSDRI